MRSYATDRPLWAMCAVAVYAATGFVDPRLGKGAGSLWGRAWVVLSGQWADPMDGAISVGFQAVALAIPSAVVGWLLQAVALVCGLRLTRRPDRDHADEYGDPPGP